MAESANVDILINAFTDAAEDALDDVGDELNNLSLDGEAAQVTLDEVADELDDATTSGLTAGEALDSIDAERLAVAMGVLANQADEAGDEIAQAGRRATVTSGAFSSLSVSTGGLTLSLSALSTAMVLSLIPALVTLSSVLVPLAGTLGFVATAGLSLAAVFGGLAVAGAVTHLQELKTALQEAKTAIMDIITPLGDVFGPLLVDAVEALPTLVQRIVDSLGPLDQFADTVRELGATAMDAIPALTGVMFDLAVDALPAVIDAMQWLMSNGPGILSAMREATERLGPALMTLGGATADLLGAMNDLGMVVGDMVIPALTSIFGAIEQAIDFVMNLDDSLRDLTVAGTITAPVIFGIASALGSLLGPLGLAAAAVAGFVAAYRSDFLGIRQVVDDAISGVIGLLTDLTAQFRPTFRIIRQTLAQNESKFQRFGQMARSALDGLVAVLQNVVLPAMRFVFANFVIPLVERLATVWSQNFGTILSEVIQTIEAIVAFIKPALTWLSAFWKKHGQTITTAVRFAFDAIIGIIGTALDLLYTTVITVLNILQGDWGAAWDAMAGFVTDTLQGILEFLDNWGVVDAFMDPINSLIQSATAGFNGLIRIINDAIRAMNEVPGVDLQTISTLSTTTDDAGRIQQERAATRSADDRGQSSDDIKSDVTLSIEGTGPLADLIRDEAEATVESKRRDDERRNRRQNPTT